MTLTQDGFTCTAKTLTEVEARDRALPSDAEVIYLAWAKARLESAQRELLDAVRHFNGCQHDRTIDAEAISNTFHDEIGELND